MKLTTPKIILVYLMLCLIWGSTWLGIRVSLESLPPLISSGFRFIVASAGILILMRVRGITLQKNKVAIKLYLIMGIFSFIIAFGLVYWAEQYVPSGLASVLFGVYPFFVALFSYFMIPEEPIGTYKIIGMILGFFGIIVIFSDSFGADLSLNLIGMMAVVLSGIVQAATAVIIKREGKFLNPLSMNFVPMLIAGIGLTILGLIFEDPNQIFFDSKAIISVLYLAIFGSIVTFTSFYWLMKKVNVVILSLIAFITPIVALFLGWLIYNENLTRENIIGAIMVLIGLVIANLQGILKPKIIR
jgi:drug/metabolite transporter (DMT)-like permease